MRVIDLNKDAATYLADTCDRVSADASNNFRSALLFGFSGVECTSPIEQMMAVGLLYCINSHAHYGGLTNLFFNLPRPERAPSDGFIICPQREIGPYRADFAIYYKHVAGVTMNAIIECDGHDFHEKTKEQAQKDKKRDRYLQAQGFLVLRYTGAEIFRDPIKCAAGALDIIWDRANSVKIDDK